MPFKYPALLATQKNINEAGASLLTADYTLAGVLGAYFEITFKINASGTDAAGDPQNVFNKMFSFRWKAFTQTGGSTPPAPGTGFRLKTGDATAGALPMVFASSSTQNGANTNMSATLEVVSSTQVQIVWRFYVTSEDDGYSPQFVQNLNRLLASNNTGGGYMTLKPGGQYELGATGISIITLVSEFPQTVPPSPAYELVTRENSSANEYFTPVALKWLGRDAGNTAFEWLLDSFINTTASGNIIAQSLHKPTGQPHQNKYDDNFIISSSSLSPLEDNFLVFTFKVAAGATTSMTTVRAIVMRTDDIDNVTQFMTDYEASVGVIPASDTGIGQINGAIHSPSSVVNSGSNQCVVSFRIPPAHVRTGARYRILINLYSTGTQDVYAGATHELLADDHPPFYPQADTLTADYFQESALPRGMMGYHSAFRSRFSLLKSSVENAFTYYDLTGDFDSVSYVKGQVMKPGTESVLTLTPDVGADKFLWTRGGGLQQGQNLVNTSTVFGGSFLDFIDEQWIAKSGAVDALWYISVQWEVGIESQMPNGDFVLLKCQYSQKIDARRWENEAGQPTPPPFNLTMTLYRMDGVTVIPEGTQFVCGNDEILALVEKSDALLTVDAYSIPETYGETATDGTTTDQNIKQRRGAFMGYIPAATNTEINAFDALFSLNSVMGSTINDAGVRVDIHDLGTAQKFWLGFIARKVGTSEIPFIADTVDVEAVRASDATTITADFGAWWTAFVAEVGSSVSPFNFRIVNHVTQNFAGITDGAFNNPSSDDTQIEVTVDHELYPNLLNIDLIYEIEGTISGHLVRFMVRKTFVLPSADGTISDTVDPADWYAVDFDFGA